MSKRSAGRTGGGRRGGAKPTSAGARQAPISSDALTAVFAALSHPARRQILVSLYARGGVMTAGEINDRFRHSWPTTTRHLGVLELAGILEVGRKGRLRFYALRPEPVARAAQWALDWAAVAKEVPGAADRPDWTELGFATMRNVVPPKD